MNCECTSITKIIPATVNFKYLISKGQQSVNFCDDCARAWFNKWKHTPAGQTLVIKRLPE